MFSIWAQSIKDLNVSLPWKVADPWARRREMAAFPLGLCVDIDSICRNATLSFPAGCLRPEHCSPTENDATESN